MAQKSSKDDFIREIKRPVWETGRLVSYPGDPRIIREGWHVWNIVRFSAAVSGEERRVMTLKAAV